MTKCEPRIDIDRVLEDQLVKSKGADIRAHFIRSDDRDLNEIASKAVWVKNQLTLPNGIRMHQQSAYSRWITNWHERKWKLHTTYWDGAE